MRLGERYLSPRDHAPLARRDNRSNTSYLEMVNSARRAPSGAPSVSRPRQPARHTNSPTPPNEGGEAPAGAKPLSVQREKFALAIADGVDVETAYRDAGYVGNQHSRKTTRYAPDVRARVKWILEERIRANAAARARQSGKEGDARLRLIRELEAIAYVDPGDLAQWSRVPRFDGEGNLTGYDDVLELTPSHLLTRAQRSAIKSVSRTVKKDGVTVRLDTNGKQEALALLAKILGMTASDAPPATTTINNTQVNVSAVGETSALEAARRLAFALEKAARALPAAAPAAIGGPILDLEASHAPVARSKG